MQYRPKFLAPVAWLVSLATAAVAGAEEFPRPAGSVMTLKLPEQRNPEVRAAQDQYYHLLMTQSGYLLPTIKPWADDAALKLITESKSGEHFIRPNTAVVQGLAMLYRFGPYDASVVGCTRAQLLRDTILPMIRYLTTTHVTGTRPTSDGKPWGDHWQSAYWAQMLGRAAWWIWDDLPEDLRADVRKVIAHEADRFVNKKPPHQLRRDTKAEENAWNCMIFSLAVVLLPDDPRRAAWEAGFQKWALSAFQRPADEHSDELVDGRPLSEQFYGANIYDDYTLENHRRIHPDYMGAVIFPLGCTLEYVLTGRTPPEAASFRARPIYENLKWFYLPDGGCVYPNGEDWELFNCADWADQHIQMALYCRDPDAWALQRASQATAAKVQARNPKGPYHVPEEQVYPGTPQLFLEELSRFWVMLQAAGEIVDRPRPLLGVKRLDAGKLIVHRTPNAVHTLSWGAVAMAQCVPWRLDRVVSPDQRSGIGEVWLKDDKQPLPVNVASAEVEDSANGFVGKLIIHHGDAVQARLEFQSNADGTLRIEETLTALRDVSTAQIATGLIGILNNPKWVYETHHRRVRFDRHGEDVAAMSGKVVDGAGAREIGIDDALVLHSAEPLRARYVGTKEIDGGRATDRLYLNYLDGERTWSNGQTISTYAATIAPQAEPATIAVPAGNP